MKIICNSIAIIFILVCLSLIYIMQDNALSPNIVSVPSLNAVFYSLLIGLSAFFAGFMFNQGRIEIMKSNTTKNLRKAEKAGIDTQESLDKIERLNAKIETLEIALQNALKNK